MEKLWQIEVCLHGECCKNWQKNFHHQSFLLYGTSPTVLTGWKIWQQTILNSSFYTHASNSRKYQGSKQGQSHSQTSLPINVVPLLPLGLKWGLTGSLTQLIINVPLWAHLTSKINMDKSASKTAYDKFPWCNQDLYGTALGNLTCSVWPTRGQMTLH